MHLDEDVRTRFAEHRNQPPQSRVQLEHLVDRHTRAAQAAHATGALVDLALCQRIATACLALLAHAAEHPEHADLVQAACLYFAAEDDEEDDFASPVGFDDDAEVLNYVAHHIGRPDLALSGGGQ